MHDARDSSGENLILGLMLAGVVLFLVLGGWLLLSVLAGAASLDPADLAFLPQ